MNKKAFFTLSLVIFVAMLGMGIVSPLMPIYVKSMGATGLWLGVMYSGFSLSRFLVQPVVGWYADFKGRKTLLIIGLAGYACASAGYALSRNMFELALVRLLAGAASAAIIPVAEAYIGDLVPKGKEGTWFNIFTMALFLGMAGGPLIGGVLNDLISMNAVFFFTSGFTVVSLVLLIIFVPSIQAKGKKEQSAVPVMKLLNDNQVKAISMYMASRAVFRQAISAYIPIYLSTTLGYSTSQTGLVVAAYVGADAVFQGMFGPLADRYNKNILMIIGSFLGPIFVFFIPHSDTTLFVILLLTGVAFFSGVSRAPAMAYNVTVGQRYGRMGVAMGVVNAAMAFGQFITPLVLGWVLDEYGIGVVFYSSAAIGVLTTFAIAYWLYRKQPGLAGLTEAAAAGADGK